MSLCAVTVRAGSILTAKGATNYLMDDTGSVVVQPPTLAWFVTLDSVTTDLNSCESVFLSGAEYVSLLAARGLALGGVHMPTCLRSGYAGNNLGTSANATNYVMDSTGSTVIQPATLAVFLLADKVTQDISQCQAVALSGAELAALSASSGGASQGGQAVNVTADIFVGAALVLCLALGWIAGGQR